MVTYFLNFLNSKNPSISLFKNISKLMIGNICAQIITLLTVPFITRIFSPEHFGTFSLFFAIVQIFGFLSSLSYVSAIILPSTDDKAAPIFNLSIILLGLTSIFLYFILESFGAFIFHFLNFSQLIPVLWLLPITIFINGLSIIQRYWSLRQNRYFYLSSSRFFEAFFDKFTAIIIGLIGVIGGDILILSRTIGLLFGNVMLFVPLYRFDFSKIKLGFKLSSIVDNAIFYKQYPLYANWSNLLDNISRRMLVFFTAIFFGTIPTGLVSLALTVLQIPMTFIGESIFRGFFQKLASMVNKGEDFHQLSINLLNFLVGIVLFPLVTISIIGPDLFSFVFGTEWSEAGKFASLLSIDIFSTFITRPFGAFFHVTRKQNLRLLMVIFLFICRFLSLLIFGFIGSLTYMLLSFSIVSLIVNVVFSVILLINQNFNMKDLLASILRPSVLALPFIIIIFLAKFYFFISGLLLFIICFILFVSFLSLYLYLFFISNKSSLSFNH